MMILVTGGTGTIGPRVVESLCQAGFRVRTFSLEAPSAGMFPQSVEVVVGDVTDREAVDSAMRGVEGVIHMAALLHVFSPPPELQEKYKRVNIDGTRVIVEAALKVGVRRVVLFSTIAVYGQANGQVLTEQSPVRPETLYARTKLSAEEIVLNARNPNGQLLGIVLRLGAVYGSQIKGNYERLIRALARKRFISVGRGSNRRTLVYDKDVGRAAVLAVSHPAAAGQIFNVTDGEFHTLSEIIQSVCSALGRKPPLISLPLGPTRTLINFVEKASRALGLKSPVTQELMDKYTEDIAVDGSRIQKELGFVPQYGLKEGWEEVIREKDQI